MLILKIEPIRFFMKKLLFGGITCLLFLFACSTSKKLTSLIPVKPSLAPDYFCTWNIQGYVSSFSTVQGQRNAMTEGNLFAKGRYQHWTTMFDKLHSDLYFVLDDSWDVPLSGDKDYYGSLIVDSTRFPSVKGMVPAERLTWLSDEIKKAGWRGLGLWVCAQEAPKYNDQDSLSYWKERFKWMDKADVRYWKVDWGKHDSSPQWRNFLTDLGKKYAPGLHIEHALTPAVLPTAELYRTYDVENIIAIPHTISRIGELLTYSPQNKATSILNCEDEPYIAVGTGCSIGIMRHEFNGNLPNGVQDFVFPPQGRDLKNRLVEVVRAVRWHRIAEPFKINETRIFVDTAQLHDYWVMGEHETWMNRKSGDINAKSAPAIITRGLEKPIVTLTGGESLQPYILASQYPNGAVAIAAIGRTIKKEYVTPRADVLLKVDNLNQPLGIFGHFNTITIQTKIPLSFKLILAQDLAGDKSIDVTQRILIKGDKVIISGKLIDEIGLMAATKGDKSEPGLVISFKH
jgi:hypothetical protein